jgi:hypothetical protein
VSSPIRVVRDVYDALGRLIVSTPMFIDPAQLATYQLYGWRLPFGAPTAPLTRDQIPDITKSPTDIRPWELNWSAWLNGATITSSEWLPSSPDLVLSNQSTTATTTLTWIGGGVAGEWLVTNRITSSDGRTDDQSVTVNVEQR